MNSPAAPDDRLCAGNTSLSRPPPKAYSSDRNLLHISFKTGILEDPWLDAFAPKNRTVQEASVARGRARQGEYVTLDFKGAPSPSMATR
jgi:argininosuccinate synthase